MLSFASGGGTCSKKKSIRHNIAWIPPAPDFFKLNFDGSKLEDSQTSFGFVIRNSEGSVVLILWIQNFLFLLRELGDFGRGLEVISLLGSRIWLLKEIISLLYYLSKGFGKFPGLLTLLFKMQVKIWSVLRMSRSIMYFQRPIMLLIGLLIVHRLYTSTNITYWFELLDV